MALLGVVTSIDDTGGMLYVRIDGERWRNLPSIPVARHEVVPAAARSRE
jgi:hypothetical protein